ncbi:MAG: hypothetical protein ACK4L7_07875 [Flavobacteriales bacterium]
MIERIGSTFQVVAFARLHEEPEAAAPRLVHLKAEPSAEPEEGGWRGKAIDLLSRMTDLLESILKNAREG